MHSMTHVFIRKLIIALSVGSAFLLCFISTRSHVGKVREIAYRQQNAVDESFVKTVDFERQTSQSHRHITTTIVTTATQKIRDELDAEEEPLHCEEIKMLLAKAKQSSANMYRSENTEGNRGIFFAEHYDRKTGENMKLVIKEANLYNSSNPTDIYRYNSALKELRNLRRLHAAGFQGLPRIWGSCVETQRALYAVTHLVKTKPLCVGNGTDTSCAWAQDVIRELSASVNPKEAALTFLQKAICFFVQFEKHRIFMEDISGGNFHFSTETWDLFIVDADSIILYGDSPILSRISCRKNNDCPYPRGNFWPAHALNQKIYYGCAEMHGVCVNNTCQGFDSRLHTCGVGRWLVTSLRQLIPVTVYNDYREMKDCMKEFDWSKRCSISEGCDRAIAIAEKYRQAEVGT